MAFKTLADLQAFMDEIIKKYINCQRVKSITNTNTYGNILNANLISQLA